MIPYTPESYELLHEGALALAEVESNGMCIDVSYVERAIEKSQRKISKLNRALETSDVFEVWKKTYGGKMNLDSSEQLGKVLFGKMGFESPGTTESGKFATDEESLSTVDHPFVRDYLTIKKIKKSVATNLKGILREVVDGKVHCFFNLHLVATYRSSSDSFNFQNVPIRDPEMGRMIRRSFIPRKGRQLMEIDIQGAEVRTSACYNKDPRLISYILDKTTDMHRDMAVELFKLPMKEVSKEIRHRAKNQFVFPQFYGSWYIDCAPALWGDMGKLVTTSGTSLRDHLNSVGLTELGSLDPDIDPEPGTFAHHVRQVERAMWDQRFKVYSRWKKDWYAEYQTKGYFPTLTGFVCQGYMKKNEVINYPVQGSAFHLLLWALTQVVNKELKKRKMQSLVVGQIHDSSVGDVVPGERDDYLDIWHRVMAKKLPRRFPWLLVPIEIEAEVAPVDAPWADKTPYEITP